MWSAAKESKDDILIKKLKTSETKISISDQKGSTEKTFKQIFADAKGKKTVIVTLTPGPFKDAKECPIGWIGVFKGCTPQLNALNLAAENLNAEIYAGNIHGAQYQSGKNGLLDKKGFANVNMFNATPLIKEMDFPTLKLHDKIYLGRMIVAVKPDESYVIIRIEEEVTEDLAKKYVSELNDFVAYGSTKGWTCG